MENVLDIGEVTRRTGLTSRALRFYEARGLLRPLRTNSGRRLYGPAELERLGQILALKKAGLTLSQIQRLSGRGAPDLAGLIKAQLEMIEARAAELDEAQALLLSVKSRIDRGEPIDAATFCSLIRHGDVVMEQEQWRKALERHYSSEELAHWAENPPSEGFDQADYSRQWEELGGRIEAALPLDPASTEAQAFVAEWNALLAPFRAAATPQMMEGAERFWQNSEQHAGEVKMPFSPAVWQFIQAASAAAKPSGSSGGA